MPVLASASDLLRSSSSAGLGCGPAGESFEESPVGIEPLSFLVDAAGQATIRIAIDVPPGVAGLVPKLEFTYASRQGNGLMGVGWSLGGLSAIARVKASYAIDGFNGSVQYDAHDRLALDGQRLIVVEGTYGAAGSVYSTEIQSWNRVREVANGFIVRKKDGQTLEYGTTPDSRIVAYGSDHVRVWALHAVEDLNGNRIEYSYGQGTTADDCGSYWIDHIAYTVRADMEPARLVSFRYDTRPDPTISYVGGFPVQLARRLVEVSTTLKTPQGDEPVRTYSIDYETSAATRLSRVIGIRQAGATAKGFAAASVLWTDTASPGLATGGDASALQQPGRPELAAMDVSGNGRTDMVHFWTAQQTLQASVYLAVTTDTGIAYQWASDTALDAFPQQRQVFPMDLDGDGRMDLLVAWRDPRSQTLKLSVFLSTGNGFAQTPQSPYDTGDAWDGATHLQFFAMDVNGDGRSDLVHAFGVDGKLTFAAYLSQFGEGDGFSAALVSTTDDPANPAQTAAFWAMDVNGDGMMDLVRVWRDADAQVHLTSYISSGSSVDHVSFAARVDTGLGAFSLDGQAFISVDVNGDGIQDMLHVSMAADGGSAHLATYLCNAAGGFVAGPESVFENQTIDPARVYAMGLNGGGQVSLVCPWKSADGLLNFSIFQGSPAGVFRARAAPAPVALDADADVYPCDPDGNGKADLTLVSLGPDRIARMTPLLSTGPANDLLASVTNAIGGVVQVKFLPMSDRSVYLSSESPVVPAVEGLRFPTALTTALAPALTPAQFPAQHVLGQAMYVVRSVIRCNDSSVNRFGYQDESVFEYRDAQIDTLGRGWLGFGSVASTSLQTGKKITHLYHQAYPLTGMAAATRVEADGRYATDPRVPKDKLVLLRTSSVEYKVVPDAQHAGVVQVLCSATRVAEYDYGVADYELAQTFAYDRCGNVVAHSNLGYVLPGTLTPRFPEEVVYRYNEFYNDTSAEGWAMGYLRYAKVSANASDSCISTFNPGDLRLERRTYLADTWDLQAKSIWDDSHQAFLTTAFSYDAYGNRVTQTDPGGATIRWAFDPVYRTFQMSVTFPTAAGSPAMMTEYGCDPRQGQEVARRDPNSSIFITAYDAFTRKTAMQGPAAGSVTDANMVTPLVTGSAEMVSAFRAAKVVTTETRAYLSDGQGGQFCRKSLLQSFPTDATRELVWNASYVDGQTKERQTVRQTGQTAGNAAVWKSYDAEGRTVAETLSILTTAALPPADTPVILTTYDVAGRPIMRSSPTGPHAELTSEVTWAYSTHGRITSSTAAGSSVACTTVEEHHLYDSKDCVRRSTAVSDDNAVTTFRFDRLGRLLEELDPATADNPSGVLNTAAFDSLDRKILIDNPDQNTTGDDQVKAVRYTYDAVTGVLSSESDAAHAVTTYRYDPLGRMLAQGFDDGTVIEFVYDEGAPVHVGHLTSASVVRPDKTVESKYAFSYDAYGNLAGSTLTLAGDASSFHTVSAFDPQRRLVSQVLPDASTIARTYTHGQLTALVLERAAATSLQVLLPLENYTAFNAPGRFVYGSGDQHGGAAVIDLTYSATGQLYRQVFRNAAGNILDERYGYDLLGDLLGIGKSGPAPSAFTYANQRLTSASVAGFAPSTYVYDASGNLTVKDDVHFSFTAHFVTKGTKNGVQVYADTADACGRIVTRTVEDVAQHFRYDAQGALAQILSASGEVVTQVLNDYRGRRLRQTEADGSQTTFIAPEYEVTTAADGSSHTTLYLRDGRGALAALKVAARAANAEYLRRDHKNNITHVLDDAGQVVTSTCTEP